jgi:hypothetical protein
MPDTIIRFFEVELNHAAHGCACLLSDTELAEIFILDWISLAVEEGIQLGLIDIDINSVRRFELVEVVFPQFPDIDDDPGEGRINVIAKIIDFDP